jgi:hypothetical protein
LIGAEFSGGGRAGEGSGVVGVARGSLKKFLAGVFSRDGGVVLFGCLRGLFDSLFQGSSKRELVGLERGRGRLVLNRADGFTMRRRDLDSLVGQRVAGDGNCCFLDGREGRRLGWSKRGSIAIMGLLLFDGLLL